ncbi:hypothetical protein AX17_004885 [Amanita inopinata Kibby_2008]|nr:hypothetical protein AX17_004885 [Amanita inopinata Kibby_2008]
MKMAPSLARVFSLASLASWLIVSPIHASPLSAPTHELDSRAPSGSKTIIVQMFEWTWDSIASECTNFIGPAGYGFVQGTNFLVNNARLFMSSLLPSVSPAQEHVQGTQWWTDYQPVSYILTSKRGNRSQYQNMISQCHAAGVRVIADTLFNHMSGMDSGTGVAGSSFTHYDYPGIYGYNDFHHCGLEPNDNIVNYNNALEVQTCQLVGLADLATNTTYVQGRLAQYANDLLSLGIDGFRLDAAKHISTSEIAIILGLLSRSPYITQEVIYGAGEPIQPSDYVGNGDVQEFRYTTTLKNAFLGGGISTLQNLDNMGWISGSQANVFVTNHDTERNGNSLNYNSPSNTYILATIFSLAHPYGTPTILSSYIFSGTDDGAPNGGAGTCSATGGANGWLCQHRYVAITGMAGFRNNVGSAPMTNWVSPQSQQIAFGRGSLGFVAINNADSSWTATFATSLPGGSYCDVISGTSSGGSCTAKTFTVSGGSLSVTINPRDAFAIHTGAKGTGASPVAVTFNEGATTTFGENIFLVGSIPELGNWAPASSIPLSSASYPTWSVTLNMPASQTFQYKFIRKETDGSIVWESDPNRQSTTVASGSQTISSSWR